MPLPKPPGRENPQRAPATSLNLIQTHLHLKKEKLAQLPPLIVQITFLITIVLYTTLRVIGAFQFFRGEIFSRTGSLNYKICWLKTPDRMALTFGQTILQF